MENIVIKSPGRINLLGEHVDYNDGLVLPAAIDKCIYMTLKTNGTEDRCTVKSKGFDSVLVMDLKNLAKGTEGWHNYVIGVLAEIQKTTNGLKGFDCEMDSKVPVGAGVSSSAALECGLAFGLNQLFSLGLDKWQLVKIGQNAEHHYVGTNCGIMDQFASVMGKKGHMMLLDCQNLKFEYIPADLGAYRLLLLNSNVSHNLADGEYNIRREQCEEGLKQLAKAHRIEPSFRNVTHTMLDASKSELTEVIYNRCSFVIEETNRVKAAVAALEKNDLKGLGRLMYETHQGLSLKYQVSCTELDYLVSLAREEPQVLGARMMGGGFGGCTLNLIHGDAVENFVNKAAIAYNNKFDIALTSFETVPSEGTSVISS